MVEGTAHPGYVSSVLTRLGGRPARASVAAGALFMRKRRRKKWQEGTVIRYMSVRDSVPSTSGLK